MKSFIKQLITTSLVAVALSSPALAMHGDSHHNSFRSDSLFDFYKKMIKQQLHILPVFENEKMLGVVDLQQLNEFLKLQYRKK